MHKFERLEVGVKSCVNSSSCQHSRRRGWQDNDFEFLLVWEDETSKTRSGGGRNSKSGKSLGLQCTHGCTDAMTTTFANFQTPEKAGAFRGWQKDETIATKRDSFQIKSSFRIGSDSQRHGRGFGAKKAFRSLWFAENGRCRVANAVSRKRAGKKKKTWSIERTC